MPTLSLRHKYTQAHKCAGACVPVDCFHELLSDGIDPSAHPEV